MARAATSKTPEAPAPDLTPGKGETPEVSGPVLDAPEAQTVVLPSDALAVLTKAGEVTLPPVEDFNARALAGGQSALDAAHEAAAAYAAADAATEAGKRVRTVAGAYAVYALGTHGARLKGEDLRSHIVNAKGEKISSGWQSSLTMVARAIFTLGFTEADPEWPVVTDTKLKGALRSVVMTGNREDVVAAIAEAARTPAPAPSGSGTGSGSEVSPEGQAPKGSAERGPYVRPRNRSVALDDLDMILARLERERESISPAEAIRLSRGRDRATAILASLSEAIRIAVAEADAAKREADRHTADADADAEADPSDAELAALESEGEADGE